MEITFTRFANQTDSSGEVTTQTWAAWVSEFREHRQTGRPEDKSARAAIHNKAKDHGAILLGLTDGLGRKKEHVRELHAMGIDLDTAPEPQVLEIFQILQSFEFVSWTTHKHGSDEAGGLPRVRIVLPLETPYRPENHQTYWSGLNKLIGGQNDPSTKNVNRIHYLPTTFDLRVAETHHNAGRFLRVEDLPLESPPPPCEVFSVDIEEIRSDMLKNVAKLPKGDTRKTALRALLTGEDFGAQGNSHALLLSCVNYLAGKKKLDRGQFEALVGESLQIRASRSKTPEPIEVVFADYMQRWETRQQENEQNHLAAIGVPRLYTEADFARIVKAQGLETQEDLRERWILQYDESAWFLGGDGYYHGPISKGGHAINMKRHLGPAVNLLSPATQNAPPKIRSYQEVLLDHGTALDEVRADLALQHSVLEYTEEHRVLHEAVRPIRTDLSPHYDPEIDEWLRKMSGPVYGKTLDWLSVYMDLSQPLCAIYIAGPQGCGKNLFARGTAKVWTPDSPTDLVTVLGNRFNNEIAKCPLLFGDEKIQTAGMNVTAEIRKMIGNPGRRLEVKYQTPRDLSGHVRIVLAANNDKMLRDNEVKTQDDLEAIALRFLYMQPTASATRYLRQVPKEKVEMWGESGIARHALWLQKNHTIQNPGQRFLVEGDLSSMTTGLVLAEPTPNFVCETLVRFLEEPDRLLHKGSAKIMKKDGKLYATPTGVKEAWPIYLDRTHLIPETRPISDTLKTISAGKRSVRPPGGSPAKFYEINLDYLANWTQEHGEISGDELRELVGQDSQERAWGEVTRIHGDGTDPDPTGEQY